MMTPHLTTEMRLGTPLINSTIDEVCNRSFPQDHTGWWHLLNRLFAVMLLDGKIKVFVEIPVNNYSTHLNSVYVLLS